MQTNFPTVHYTGAQVRRVYIYPLIYTGTLLHYFFADSKNKKGTSKKFNELLLYMLFVVIMYYNLCFFHEHYYVWFIPLLVLLWNKIANVAWLHLGQVLIYIYTFMFKSDFLFSKFIPFGSGNWAIPLKLESFFESFIYRSVAHLGPTFLVMLNLYLIFSIFRKPNYAKHVLDN